MVFGQNIAVQNIVIQMMYVFVMYFTHNKHNLSQLENIYTIEKSRVYLSLKTKFETPDAIFEY